MSIAVHSSVCFVPAIASIRRCASYTCHDKASQSPAVNSPHIYPNSHPLHNSLHVDCNGSPSMPPPFRQRLLYWQINGFLDASSLSTESCDGSAALADGRCEHWWYHCRTGAGQLFQTKPTYAYIRQSRMHVACWPLLNQTDSKSTHLWGVGSMHTKTHRNTALHKPVCISCLQHADHAGKYMWVWRYDLLESRRETNKYERSLTQY